MQIGCTRTLRKTTTLGSRLVARLKRKRRRVSRGICEVLFSSGGPRSAAHPHWLLCFQCRSCGGGATWENCGAISEGKIDKGSPSSDSLRSILPRHLACTLYFAFSVWPAYSSRKEKEAIPPSQHATEMVYSPGRCSHMCRFCQ